MPRSSRLVTGVGALILALAPLGVAAQASCPDPTTLLGDLPAAAPPSMAHVRFLADDALEGREVGTAGARCAAAYIVGVLQAAGLEPAGHEEGTRRSWYHTFPVRSGARMGPTSTLEISGEPLEVGKMWMAPGYAADGGAEGELAYAGSLLSRPGTPEEDVHAHAPITGTIVVAEWGDPDAPGGRSLRSDPHFKATVAAGRGAAGLVVLLPDGMELPTLEGETRAQLDIPVVLVHADAAERIRAAARSGTSARLRTQVEPVFAEARNVAAILPGSDPELRDEYIVVGAHYDHLGFGGEGSLDPDRRAIHNGADDNASGTAAILEVAEELATGVPPARSVLFLAFTGEEKGLWGSARFVAEPTVPLESIQAMLNLDMVGRLAEDRLTVFGMATAEEWEDLLRESNAELTAPLELALAPDGYGPSDHASFHGVGIPVVHLFTNTHPDYHRPEDDWERVNGPGLERVIDLTSALVRRLAGDASTTAQSLTLPEDAPSAPAHGGGAAADPHSGVEAEQTASRGYGPYLGTIPDMSPRAEGGLRLSGVREDSPASRAGLRAGDVVVEFAGRTIGDIYAYTYALRDHQPGDEVEIVVERDGERVTVTAVLAQR